MYDTLLKFGYDKVKPGAKKSVIQVYAPRSEREIVLKDIAKKFNTVVDSSYEAKKISSIGAVFVKGTAGRIDMYIVVRPDADKSLSTDEQESLAGLYISTIIKNPNTDFTYDELVKYGDPNLYSKHKANTIYEKASKFWLNSSMVIAKALYPHIKSKNLEVHQRSSSKFVSNLSTTAKTLIKAAGVNAQLDKWNPADIWLVKPTLATTDFSQFETINALNEWLVEKYKTKEVIGVSLKAVGNTAKVQEFNLTKSAPRGIKFDGFNLGKSGFLNAMDMNILFNQGGDQGSINIRSFGRPENVSGDIAGKTARGGKIGAGQLFSVIRKYNSNFSTPSDREIVTKFSKDPMAVTSMLYEKMQKLVPEEASRITPQEYHEAVMKKGNAVTYVISKTQASNIALAIDGMTDRNKNAMIEEIFDYAASSLAISSVFIKVS